MGPSPEDGAKSALQYDQERSRDGQGNIWITIAEVAINALMLYGSYRLGKSILKVSMKSVMRSCPDETILKSMD